MVFNLNYPKGTESGFTVLHSVSPRHRCNVRDILSKTESDKHPGASLYPDNCQLSNFVERILEALDFVLHHNAQIFSCCFGCGLCVIYFASYYHDSDGLS